MFCPKCMLEYKDDSRFCEECGTPLIIRPEYNNLQERIGGTGEKENHQRRLMLGIGGILLLTVAVGAGIGTGMFMSSQNSPNGAAQEVSFVNDEGKDITDKIEDEQKTDTEDEQKANVEGKPISGMDQTDKEEAEGKKLVCVPTSDMSLREKAGSEKNIEVLKTLYPGDRLLWTGEKKKKNDIVYYKVKDIQSGIIGYVHSGYCVPVDFEYEEDELGIVDTSNALYSYEDMERDMEELARNYPESIRYEVAGESLDHRNLYEITLGNPQAEKHIFVQATIHAREYMNTQLVMKMIEYYAHYYNSGSYDGTAYKDLFDHTAFHILPMANPDGVALCQEGIGAIGSKKYQKVIRQCYERDKKTLDSEIDEEGYTLWMDKYKDKSFRQKKSKQISFEEYLTIWKANVAGIDLNRNFDAGWNGIKEKKKPAYSSYKGEEPESEPETRCLTKLANKREYECYLSYHSTGGLIYYDVKGNSSSTAAKSQDLADLMKQHTGYRKVKTEKAENVVLGGFGDWVQLSLEKPSVTLECGKHPCPLEINEFESIWLRYRESWASLISKS